MSNHNSPPSSSRGIIQNKKSRQVFPHIFAASYDSFSSLSIPQYSNNHQNKLEKPFSLQYQQNNSGLFSPSVPARQSSFFNNINILTPPEHQQHSIDGSSRRVYNFQQSGTSSLFFPTGTVFTQGLPVDEFNSQMMLKEKRSAKQNAKVDIMISRLTKPQSQPAAFAPQHDDNLLKVNNDEAQNNKFAADFVAGDMSPSMSQMSGSQQLKDDDVVSQTTQSLFGSQKSSKTKGRRGRKSQHLSDYQVRSEKRIKELRAQLESDKSLDEFERLKISNRISAYVSRMNAKKQSIAKEEKWQKVQKQSAAIIKIAQGFIPTEQVKRFQAMVNEQFPNVMTSS